MHPLKPDTLLATEKRAVVSFGFVRWDFRVYQPRILSLLCVQNRAINTSGQRAQQNVK